MPKQGKKLHRLDTETPKLEIQEKKLKLECEFEEAQVEERVWLTLDDDMRSRSHRDDIASNADKERDLRESNKYSIKAEAFTPLQRQEESCSHLVSQTKVKNEFAAHDDRKENRECPSPQPLRNLHSLKPVRIYCLNTSYMSVCLRVSFSWWSMHSGRVNYFTRANLSMTAPRCRPT